VISLRTERSAGFVASSAISARVSELARALVARRHAHRTAAGAIGLIDVLVRGIIRSLRTSS
jgi:hypothetical protein